MTRLVVFGMEPLFSPVLLMIAAPDNEKLVVTRLRAWIDEWPSRLGLVGGGRAGAPGSRNIEVRGCEPCRVGTGTVREADPGKTPLGSAGLGRGVCRDRSMESAFPSCGEGGRLDAVLADASVLSASDSCRWSTRPFGVDRGRGRGESSSPGSSSADSISRGVGGVEL